MTESTPLKQYETGYSEDGVYEGSYKDWQDRAHGVEFRLEEALKVLSLFYQHVNIWGIVGRKFETDARLIAEHDSQEKCFEAYHEYFKIAANTSPTWERKRRSTP